MGTLSAYCLLKAAFIRSLPLYCCSSCILNNSFLYILEFSLCGWYGLLLLKALSFFLTQEIFLDLSCRGTRYFAKFYLLRALKMRYPLAAKAYNLFGSGAGPRFWGDQTLNYLSPLFVRHTKTGGFSYIRVSLDAVLHFETNNILPPADNDILEPVL